MIAATAKSREMFFLLTSGNFLLTGIAACLVFSNLVGSNSRAAIISMTITSIIILLYLRKQIISGWKQSLAVFVCFILIFAGINHVKGGYTGSWLGSAFTARDIRNEDIAVDKIKSFTIKDSQLILECT